MRIDVVSMKTMISFMKYTGGGLRTTGVTEHYIQFQNQNFLGHSGEKQIHKNGGAHFLMLLKITNKHLTYFDG